MQYEPLLLATVIPWPRKLISTKRQRRFVPTDPRNGKLGQDSRLCTTPKFLNLDVSSRLTCSVCDGLCPLAPIYPIFPAEVATMHAPCSICVLCRLIDLDHFREVLSMLAMTICFLLVQWSSFGELIFRLSCLMSIPHTCDATCNRPGVWI